jgi:hypothetical protein
MAAIYRACKSLRDGHQWQSERVNDRVRQPCRPWLVAPQAAAIRPRGTGTPAPRASSASNRAFPEYQQTAENPTIVAGLTGRQTAFGPTYVSLVSSRNQILPV